MFILLVELVVAFAVIFYVRKQIPFWIGQRGENFVSRCLRQLDATHYRTIDNVLLPSEGNLATTQIDHVVVSNYGIFCIETKTYKGWIFGDARQEYWTQVIYRHKERFYNPLRQNYAHVKAVEKLVTSRYPNAKIYSFITFPAADKLKISGTDSVGSARDIVQKIGACDNVILSDDERDGIYGLISQANLSLDKEIRRVHDEGVRALK
jgi:hypothetical protein